MNFKYAYPLVVAALLTACGDSSSDPTPNAVAGGKTSNGGNPAADVKLGCDFKIEDNAWTFGYPGLEGFGSTYQLTYEINGADVVVTDKSIESHLIFDF